MLFTVSLENRDELVGLFLLWDPHIETQRVMFKGEKKKRKELIVGVLLSQKMNFDVLVDLFDLKSLENLMIIPIPESLREADVATITFYVEDVMNSDASMDIVDKEEVHKLLGNLKVDE